jgi:hypothetical protein
MTEATLSPDLAAVQLEQLRKWPTDVLLRLLNSTSRALTERGAWAEALGVACGVDSAASDRAEAIFAAAKTAIDEERILMGLQTCSDEEDAESLRMDRAEPSRGCRFWSSISALGCLALLVVGFCALVVACWKMGRAW